MSNVKDGDIFMVSRDGTEFQVKNEDTSNLRDTDLFWVQREGVNYSVSADQVNAGGDVGPPELSTVTLVKTTNGDRYTDQQFLTSPSYTAPGNPPPTIGLKAEVTGALSIAGATDEIVGINGNTFTLASDANLETFKAGDAVKQNNSPDITATFVSADPSVPSMTVSDVVGPWSANTGNYVENTVVNPILIKPETSAITEAVAIEGNPFTSTQYDGFLGCFEDFGSGSLNTTSSGSACYFDTPILVNRIDYQGEGLPLDGTGSYEVLVRVKDGNTTVVPNWQPPTTIDNYATFDPPINLTAITIDIASSSTITTGLSLNGGDIKIIPETTLTLTDDTDLANFATGDAVYAGGVVAPASFAPVIYTGNPSGTGRGPVDVGFAPDLVWIKRRNGAAVSHNLMNSLLPDKKLKSDTTDAVADAGAFAFTSNGFQPSNSYEQSYGDEYVAWCWSAGDTTVTNNEGSVEAQVRSNGDFSIVKWASVSGTTTFGHGLTNAPKFVITKNTGDATWYCYHESIGYENYLVLNGSAGSAAASWEAAPTDTLFTYGAGFSSGARDDVIAYCWADSPTQSFGSYAGGSAEQTITLGFAPAFVLIKSATSGEQWYIYDTARQPSDSRGPYLQPNTSAAEDTITARKVELNDSGFTVVGTDGAVNGDNHTYIYAAFGSAGGPSGVVGDITGLDMTLSESSGTWEVGQTVTMDEKPALVTTASLVFDANGQVSDVVGNADFVNMNSNTPIITLPSTLGDGSTPDETLPDGTSIKTTVRAWNELGESVKSSNSVTPTSTTKLSMGETRVIDGYTPVVTAHARAVVTEAEEIKEDINRATDQLNIAIANYEEQGKRRSV